MSNFTLSAYNSKDSNSADTFKKLLAGWQVDDLLFTHFKEGAAGAYVLEGQF